MGFAYDVAAASQYNAFLSGGFYSYLFSNSRIPLSGGNVARAVYGHAPYIDGMKAIHIFAVVDGFQSTFVPRYVWAKATGR